MTLREEAIAAVEKVPEAKLPMLIEFARFLDNSPKKESGERLVEKPLRRGGWIKGEIYMSPDFNDSLEIVSEKEMRVLQVMRTTNTAFEEAELQEVAV
ncbi:MAG: hypothetical protein IJP53_02500 [Synergistaceae bacterium]|nr:hypothetical protein [Synergistaceae bacterium]